MEEIYESVKLLLSQAGVIGSEIWRIALQQAPIEIAINAFIFLLSAGIAFFVWVKFGAFITEWKKRNEYDDADVTILYIGRCALVALFVVLGIASLYDMLTWFANPEYAALKMLIRLAQR